MTRRRRTRARRLVVPTLIAAAVLGLASQAGGQDEQGTVGEALTEQNWFVDDVSESDGRTTVTFAWTDSYFAARACLATLNAVEGMDSDSVSVVFGEGEPLTCAEVRADPIAAIWTPPEEESEEGAAPMP